MKGWYDLSRTFASGMPVPEWPGERNQEFTLTSFHMDNTGGNQNFMSLNLHCGTHVDAPGHYAPGGISIEKVPFERLMGTCLAIDLARGPLEPIGAADLRPYESRIGQTDMLFIRTGADDMWGTADYVRRYPYLTEEAGHYLVKTGAKVVGLDTIGPDPALRSGLRKGSPLHFTLLGNDVLIIENLANLKSVVGREVYVYAFPIKIEGAFGAPARVLARDIASS